MHNSEIQLQAIIKGARAILEKDSFVEAARAIFDCCCEMTGAISGYVALLDEHKRENELLFLEDGGLACTVSHDLPMPIRGLREEAYKKQKTVYDNDFMESKWVEFMPEGHVILRNVLFAPLSLQGETVGIIGLANKPVDFTEDDANVASVFGELAAIALMNSRNIDRLKHQKADLEETLGQIRTLEKLLPICSHCKSIRNNDGAWLRVDTYIAMQTDTMFSHGICPDCIKKFYPEY
jgi:GAF domain-containing protein